MTGEPIRRTVTGPPVPDRETLARDHHAGVSVERLSRRHHIGASRVRAELAAAGATITSDRSAAIRAGRERAASLNADDVVAAYQQPAVSVRALANRFDVSDNTIRLRLQTAGVRVRSFAELHDHIDVDRLVAAYQGGVSARGLARQYGLDRLTIRDRLTAAGVTIRPAGGTSRSVAIDRRLVADYLAGGSLHGLARTRPVSVATIRRILIASGVTIRPAGGAHGPRRKTNPPTTRRPS